MTLPRWAAVGGLPEAPGPDTCVSRDVPLRVGHLVALEARLLGLGTAREAGHPEGGRLARVWLTASQVADLGPSCEFWAALERPPASSPRARDLFYLGRWGLLSLYVGAPASCAPAGP